MAAIAFQVSAPVAADASFDAIVTGTTAANHAESCERMQAWVDAHASDPVAARGLVWMAQLRRSDRRGDLARPLLERVRRDYPTTDWALHAQKGIADLDVEAHHFASAIASYDELAKKPSPFWQYVGTQAAKVTRGERTRFYWLLAVAIAILALAAVRLWRGDLRALWPPPVELVYALPLLVVMLLAATAQEHDESRAVVTVAMGAAVLLWLNGAHFRASRLAQAGIGRRSLAAALGAAQIAGLVYCALVMNNLWGKLADTVAMGIGAE
jgi:hypothetical protein